MSYCVGCLKFYRITLTSATYNLTQYGISFSFSNFIYYTYVYIVTSFKVAVDPALRIIYKRSHPPVERFQAFAIARAPR